jgi:glycosyltransferase involved in cell wall biosynthesis
VVATLHRRVAVPDRRRRAAIVLREGSIPPGAGAEWSSFAEWRKKGLGLLRAFRLYSPVELRVWRGDTISRPFATGAIMRWISKEPVLVRAADGALESWGWPKVASLGLRAVRDAFLAPRIVRAALQRVAALEPVVRARRKVRWEGPRDGRPLYLRTEPWYGILTGGSVAHTAGVVNGLIHEAGRPFVVAPERPSLLSEEAEVILLDPPARYWDYPELRLLDCDAHFGRQALSLAAALRPGFVYHRYAAFSTAGVRVALAQGIPLVLEYNGSEVWIRRHWGRAFRREALARRVENLNLEAADLVVVVSSVLRDELMARGVSPDRVLMLANGVDVDRFRPDVSGAAVRARYGLGSDLVIGFVGTFGPWHGATVLARAFSTLAREEAGGMRLLLVGDGEEMAGVRLALGGLVDEGRAVLAGAILPQEVPAHLAACDVLVAAHVPNPDGTEFFGSPTKLFEYMASGRAIVASSLGQLAEVLEHGRTALLVEPGSPDDLARAVRRLVTDPVLRRRLGDAAREAAVERHSWKEHTRRIVRALQERCE